jgi:hypothetical protein
MEHLVEVEIHSPECIAETMKKVTIDESKNTSSDQPVELKPDTPKIPVKQFSFKFLLTDTFTDSIIGLYPTNRIATNVMIDLVKEDLMLYVDYFKKNILFGESVEDNRNHLSNIKQLLYQYNTIEQSQNTSVMIDGEVKNRYRITIVKENNTEISTTDFININ